MEKISYEQYTTILDNIVKKLLDPNQVGGAWFNGSESEFEEWAGDAFCEVVLQTLHEVGVHIDDNE